MKNAIEDSADKTKKKMTESRKASENGIKSANKENVSALNIQGKKEDTLKREWQPSRKFPGPPPFYCTIRNFNSVIGRARRYKPKQEQEKKKMGTYIRGRRYKPKQEKKKMETLASSLDVAETWKNSHQGDEAKESSELESDLPSSPGAKSEDKFTIRVSFPEGGSCYRTTLQKIIRTADTVHQPRPLLLSYESKEKADQQLEVIKNLTVNGMPVYAQHEGLPKQDVNVPASDPLRRKLILNHHYNIEIVRKFFKVNVEQHYNNLIPTKIFYLTFPTAASATAASAKQYDFYGEKVKLVKCTALSTYKDFKKYNKGPGKQKSSGSKSEQKTNVVHDKETQILPKLQNQTKKTEIISKINGEDTKTDKEIKVAKTDMKISEKIDANKEIGEKIDTDKENDEEIDTDKEIGEKIDTDKENGEEIDAHKEIAEEIDTGKEIDEKIDNDDDRQACDNKNVDRTDKEDDDDDVIVEEEVATTSDEIKEEKQTKDTELINEVINEDTKTEKEMIEKSDNDGDFKACDKNAEKKDKDDDDVIVEEEVSTAIVAEEVSTAIVAEEIATASEEIKEKRPPKKKTKKTSKTKTDKELTEKTDEGSVVVEKTEENSKGDEETNKNFKDVDQMGDIMGDIIEDIKSGEKTKQDTSVGEELD